MFAKQQPTKIDRPAASAKEPLGKPAPSIISSDMRVTGDLRTDGDVQIDGVVEGDIISTNLTIGKSAEINGEIQADTVRVWGRVNGKIRGKHVTLQETAEVNGDIFHETLEVARGAFVEGLVKRNRIETPSVAALIKNAPAKQPLPLAPEVEAKPPVPAIGSGANGGTNGKGPIAPAE